MPTKPRQSGYSLLEILAALTVLVIGFGALNSLTGSAQNSAMLSRELSIVQQVCQTRMNELVAGTVPLRTTMDEPIPDLDDWTLSVTLDPAQRRGILVVAVSARRHDAPNQAVRRGGRFRIVHWLNVADPPKPMAAAPSSQSGFSYRRPAADPDAPRAGTMESLFSNPNAELAPRTTMTDAGMTVDLPPLGLPDEPANLPELPAMDSPPDNAGVSNW